MLAPPAIILELSGEGKYINLALGYRIIKNIKSFTQQEVE